MQYDAPLTSKPSSVQQSKLHITLVTE